MKVAALNLQKVTKRYGSSRGVNKIDIKVNQGEVFGFIGPNGAGKTTTIRMILDFIRPTEGTVKVLGLDSKKDSVAIHKRIGYLSGDFAMDRHLTGRQYIEYMANLRGGISWGTIQKLIDRFQCETNRKIGNLSRGNQQKIGLVVALMHEPDLLILDEPTSGLDPLMQAEFNKVILERSKTGKTTFISSHVLSEVQELCDRVAFIKEGEIVTVQPLKAITKQTFKKVTFSLTRIVKPEMFKNVKEVQDLEIIGKTAVCKVNGDFTGLIKALAKYKVTNLDVEEPDLEDLFMGMYSNKASEQENV